MPASQLNITDSTPMGANLIAGGATFRTWAREAVEVYIALGDPGGAQPSKWTKNPNDLLVRDANGYWTGFFPGVKDGDEYRYYIVGKGDSGFKRDPYARELQLDGYPECNCIVRTADNYQWRAPSFRPPPFEDLLIYQFHIGVFYAKNDAGQDIRANRVCKILDVVDRIEYWANLGINAIMPLPFQEYQGENSLGYNGTDLFSPEMDYTVRAADLGPYLQRVNRLFAAKGCPTLTAAQLQGQSQQLKTFIDLCHLYGIAVIADVVYNHAGGPFDQQSLYFFDRQPGPDNNNSLYFLRDGHAGGLIFAFWKQEVRQFLIDNGKALIQEYHVDGLRYDQVTVIAENGGWNFAQDLSSTLRFFNPASVQIAEYWGKAEDRWKGVAAPPYGMGFDVGYSDGLRDNLRKTIAETTGGKFASVNLDRVRDALYLTFKNPGRWSVFQCLENHDLLDDNHGDKQPRIPALCDAGNSRSWYARSRSKVATGLLLTAPGIPMLFMGQEFLEDKYWTDYPKKPELLIWWAGLEGQDRHMSDQHRFTRDLLWLRRKHPALRGEGLNVFHVHNANRVIGFHRWIPAIGRDIVCVASLNETTFYNSSYRIGFPGGGHWNEVFNSDVYDQFVNPNVQGNAGGITADGPPWDGMSTSATLTLPANSLLVFARDWGDF